MTASTPGRMVEMLLWHRMLDATQHMNYNKFFWKSQCFSEENMQKYCAKQGIKTKIDFETEKYYN